MNGRAEVGRALLDHSALADDTDHDGNTALHWAASFGHLDFVRVLLDHPAVNEDGQTALHAAASRGHSEICRVLLDHGAFVDATDNDGNTPLRVSKTEGPRVGGHWVGKYCEERHPNVASVLLEYGATHGSEQVVRLKPE
ncbi:ankyrin [Peniophora sp. CONT]|nr:ankyrin [Peniophora sp. CONT]